MVYAFQQFYRNILVSTTLSRLICLVFVGCFFANCTTSETQKEALRIVVTLQNELKTQHDDLQKTKQRVEILKKKEILLSGYFNSKNSVEFSGILEALVTTGIYVSEFEKETREISNEIIFTKKQLADLKDDIKSNIHTPETISKYLFEEQISIEQTQNKINYLVARLETQEFFIENLKNEFNLDLP